MAKKMSNEYEYWALRSEFGKFFRISMFPKSEDDLFTDSPDEATKFFCEKLAVNVIENAMRMQKAKPRWPAEAIMY